MPWETRGGGSYFYTTRRRGRKVEKIYHGKGVTGELTAGIVDRAKQKKAKQAEALFVEKERVAEVECDMAALEECCKLMLEATLIACGYHKFNGHWRRRRG